MGTWSRVRQEAQHERRDATSTNKRKTWPFKFRLKVSGVRRTHGERWGLKTDLVKMSSSDLQIWFGYFLIGVKCTLSYIYLYPTCSCETSSQVPHNATKHVYEPANQRTTRTDKDWAKWRPGTWVTKYSEWCWRRVLCSFTSELYRFLVSIHHASFYKFKKGDERLKQTRSCKASSHASSGHPGDTLRLSGPSLLCDITGVALVRTCEGI